MRTTVAQFCDQQLSNHIPKSHIGYLKDFYFLRDLYEKNPRFFQYNGDSMGLHKKISTSLRLIVTKCVSCVFSLPTMGGNARNNIQDLCALSVLFSSK